MQPEVGKERDLELDQLLVQRGRLLGAAHDKELDLGKLVHAVQALAFFWMCACVWVWVW